MRIRTKLLLFLLVVVLTPLCSLGWYALRQTDRLGRELADNAATALEANAAKELAQTAEMLEETCANNLNMLETTLSLLSEEAARMLGRPGPVPNAPILFDKDFDAGAIPAGRLVAPAGTDVPCSYNHLVFHLPPGLLREEARRDTVALSGLLPIFRTLFARHKGLMQFGYIGLASGLHCAYPGHGGYPADYDPRTRPWYQSALHAPDSTWSVMVDAVTKQVMATMALAVRNADGPILGVAGLDIPMGALFLDSDLSQAWTGRMRAMVVSVRRDNLAKPAELVVVASRDYARKTQDWTAPVELVRLTSPDHETLKAVISDLSVHRDGVRRLSVDGTDSLLAYAPIEGKALAVALLVPREVVVAGAVRAQGTVLTAVDRLRTQMGWFAGGAVLVVLILVFPTSRVVTRPVRDLAETAASLASGDLEARAQVRGHDELADLAGAFNDMAPQLLERIRLKGDMALAMEVQQHLLPRRPPAIEGLDVAALSLYCDETGGDYFDFLEFCQDDAIQADIVVGDVTGHGVSAALFMATGRALLRGRAMGQPGPGALLTEVNALLCQDTELSGRFITLFFLRLDRQAKEIVWTRAGHDPGLLFDPATDAFTQLMGPGIPLGVTPEWTYVESRRPWLAPGQVLVLYTDGIHEARNAGDAMYGRERIMGVMRENATAPASTIINALVADLKAFKNGLPLEDDVTLVVIKATA
jgi:phosphoserine phosphatase RsbU/P